MRFGTRNLLRVSEPFRKKKKLKEIFMNNLGLSFVEANELVNQAQKKVVNLPCHRILNICLLCQKYNVNMKALEYLPGYFIFFNHKLEHRINILKELGVPELHSSLLQNVRYLFRQRISVFKEKTNIPVEQNITRNIFDKLGYDVPSQISDLESRSQVSIKQYYETCLLYCKTHYFDLGYLDDKILLNRYTKFKSIRMITDTLKVLRIDLDYNEEMIKKYPFVITASADNIKALLREFTDIYGIPIITFLRKYPFMLLEDANNIKQLLASFKRYEIPGEYVKRYTDIFRMGNDIFIERMENMRQNPNLNVWCKHPRFLQIIGHKSMAESHMEYLHYINRLNWAHPQTILCYPMSIEKFLQTNAGIVSSKKGLKYVFIKELGVDKTKILTRHQHWKTIGYVDLIQMLQYLKKHFTINEICDNIHIILYAQPRVEKILADLKKQYSQSTQYSFTNNQYLALCLYTLEKDTHFTGDGIWSIDHKVKQQSKEDGNTKKLYNDDNINLNINNNNNINNDLNENDKKSLIQ